MRYPEAGGGCVPGVCGPARLVPVQIREHVDTGERRSRAAPEQAVGRRRVHRDEKVQLLLLVPKFHLHHCSACACDSAERGHVVETATGDKACGISGRILEVGTTYDWKERKKGAYTARTVRRPDPSLASVSASDSLTAQRQRLENDADSGKRCARLSLQQTEARAFRQCEADTEASARV